MNPYETLGIGKHCSRKEIDKAYRRLSMIHHPDKGGDSKKFDEISLAVQILRDPHRRKLYDEYGLSFDMSADMMSENIKAKFKEIVDEWIRTELQLGRNVPIKNFFNEVFQQQFSAIDERKSTLNKQILYISKRKKQIRSADEVSIVHVLMDKQIESLKNEIMDLEKSRYFINRVKDFTNGYSSDDVMNDCQTYSTYFYTR